MNIRAIRNVNDHAEAIARLSSLMDRDREPDSDEADELDVPATLIEQFEAEHFPI